MTGSFAAKFQCDLCCRYRFLRGLENPILLMVSCAWRGPNPALTATSQWLQETPRLGKSLPSSLIQSLLTLVRCLGDQAVDGGGEMMWLVRKPDEIRVWKGPGVWPVPAEGETPGAPSSRAVASSAHPCQVMVTMARCPTNPTCDPSLSKHLPILRAGKSQPKGFASRYASLWQTKSP